MGKRKGDPGPKTAWKPGQTGNPFGRRPPGDWVSDREFCRMARSKSPAALRFLVEVMEDPEEQTGHRIRAAEVIVERAHGKAAQTHLLDALTTNLNVTCTPQDLIALAEEMALTDGDPIYPVNALMPASETK